MSRTHQTGSSPDAAQNAQNQAVATRRLEHALAVKWRLIDRLKPYERNPRVAPEAAVAKVAASLAEFGWRQPIVVDEGGVIIAGHTRLLAAKRLGLARVPVHVAAGLSPAQVRAYRLADNRTAEETAWDLELLPTEIGELAGLGYDLDLLAFDGKELARLTAQPSEGLSDPDEAPEPPPEPLTQPGDLWQLGEHRLLCGDATKGEDVRRLMAGRRAALMATDPPYLVGYAGGTHPPTQANGGKSGKAYEKQWDALESIHQSFRPRRPGSSRCSLHGKSCAGESALPSTDRVRSSPRQAGSPNR